MGKVYVAGSIIMDVVATTARAPKIGETVLGNEHVLLPRRQGRQPGRGGGAAWACRHR